MAAPFRFNRQKPAPCCHCASKVFMSRLEHSNQFGRFSMPHRFDRCDSMAIQRQFLHHPASCRDRTARLVAVWATIAITFCYEINFWCPAARAAQNLAALQHFIGKTGACQFSSAPRHVLAGERKHNRYKDIFVLRKRSCAPTIQYTKAPNVRLYRLIIYRLAGWKYYISEISDIRHLGAHRVPAIISPSKDKFSPHTLS